MTFFADIEWNKDTPGMAAAAQALELLLRAGEPVERTTIVLGLRQLAEQFRGYPRYDSLIQFADLLAETLVMADDSFDLGI